MSQTPERVFRIGMVTASVFTRKLERNGEPERTVRSVSLQKRYVDNGETKFSSSFGLSELPQAIEVLRLAMKYVAHQEAELIGDEPIREAS